ncbi:hypothetical protein ACOME3_009777 [Neoechinorhynchus agilis]
MSLVDKVQPMRRVSNRAVTRDSQPCSRSSRSSTWVTSNIATNDPTSQYRESLPVDLAMLSATAMDLKMYAKALHYTEVRFALDQSEEVIEDLISINNQLDQSEAAYGAVFYARKRNMNIKELWYEKLNEWDRALRMYEYRQVNEADDEHLMLGRMRCLHALGEWQQLKEMCAEKLQSPNLNIATLRSIAEIGSSCAWRMNSERSLKRFINNLPPSTVNACKYRTISLLTESKYREAYVVINEAWDLLYQRFLSVASEDYRRNYEVSLCLYCFRKNNKKSYFRWFLMLKCLLSLKKLSNPCSCPIPDQFCDCCGRNA